MPIQINYRNLPISPDEVRTILQSETDSFGTFFNLDRILYHEGRYRRTAEVKYPEFRAMCGVPNIRCTQRNDVRNIFMRRFNIPEYKVMNKDNKVSMAQDVVEKLLKDETSARMPTTSCSCTATSLGLSTWPPTSGSTRTCQSLSWRIWTTSAWL